MSDKREELVNKIEDYMFHSAGATLDDACWIADYILENYTPNSEIDEKIKAIEKRVLLNVRDLINDRSYLKTFLRTAANWSLVQQILQNRTREAGRTSSIEKCVELGLNPDSKGLEIISENTEAK